MQPNSPMTDERLAVLKHAYQNPCGYDCNHDFCATARKMNEVIAEVERLRAAEPDYLSRESLKVIYERFGDDQTVSRKELEWVRLRLRAMCSEPPRQPQAPDDQRERGGGD